MSAAAGGRRRRAFAAIGRRRRVGAFAAIAFASALVLAPLVAAARPSHRGPRGASPAATPAAIADVGPAYLVIPDGWSLDPPASGSPAGSAAAPAGSAASPAGSAGSPAGPADGATVTRLVLHGPDNAILSVTRLPVGNLPAWSRSTRDAHVDELVAGFTAVDGATVLRRTVTTDGPSNVPVLELTLLRHDHPVAIRVILFRTLTVAAAADGPHASRDALERAVAGLHPDR